MTSACEKCGLRAWQRELERRGIVVRFCDLCYWDEREDRIHSPLRRGRGEGEPTPMMTDRGPPRTRRGRRCGAGYHPGRR